MKLENIDIEFLKEKGITPEQLESQLEMLKTGFPYLKLEGACTVGHGITRPSRRMQRRCVSIWDKYVASGASIEKMVPASGAASRMFKNVFAFVNAGKEAADDFMRDFFANITKFAFFPKLNEAAMKVHGLSVLSMLEEGRTRDVAELLLGEKGLGYGSLPKALLRFHKVTGSARTPLEEHLAEGAQYAVDKNGNVKVHFTVSPEHLPLAQAKVEEVIKALEQEYGVRFNVTFSLQKPSTDTIAANLDGTPYREDGKLFFRPGGHGALIENLNDLKSDIVFLKNIDNVVPDHNREMTIHYKKVIGGVLVAVKVRLDEYCRILEGTTPDEKTLRKMVEFAREVLCITHDNCDNMKPEELRQYLMQKFDRPLRVCGMVANEGEPGGGPFMVYNPDGTVSPQILESSQINMDDPASREMLEHASHFNPVDLVCALHDYKGGKFNLPEYVDVKTGFISSKSRQGVEIKALELPGLWNGAMADWNTIFVEVPGETFNPVKTVNDLLRPAHQPESM